MAVQNPAETQPNRIANRTSNSASSGWPTCNKHSGSNLSLLRIPLGPDQRTALTEAVPADPESRRHQLLRVGPPRRRPRPGAKVVGGILFEYTRIAADMKCSEMIVSPDYCVDRHGDTLYRGDDTAQLRWGDARA